MKHAYSFLLFVLLPLFCFTQNIIYVRTNATPVQDGTSWQTAFADVHSALTAARYGDQVWVAAGTYRIGVNADRSSSFILKNGVQLYGGFWGDETDLEQRDWQMNVTTLSGEIGQPGRADNTYHVVYGKGLDSTTVLDGFAITGAYGVIAFDETPVFENCGGGILLEGQEGIKSRPAIRNCHIYGNASNYGGGIYVGSQDLRASSSSGGPVNPFVEGCLFERNYAFWSGGGIFKTGGTAADDTIKIQSTIFRHNRARAGFGGGICLNKTTDVTLLVQDCLFERDSAIEGAGIMFEEGLKNAEKQHFIIKKTDFKNNFVRGEGIGLYYFDSPFTEVERIGFFMEDCNFEDNKIIGGSTLVFSIEKTEVDSLEIHMNQVQVAGGRFRKVLNVVVGVEPGRSTLTTKIENCIFEATGDFALSLGGQV
jgi:Right handed beta helix region